MASPELFLQVRKLGQQVVRRLALQPLHQPAYRHLGRYRHEQMDVVLRHMSFHDRNFVRRADVPNEIPHSRRYFTHQRLSTILRRPYQMQMYLEYCMRAAPVIRHLQSLSSARSLEAVASRRGLQPSQTGTMTDWRFSFFAACFLKYNVL